MDDLISRQAAIDEIKEIYEWHDNVTKERIIEHFERLPSAQPERKRGKWILKPNIYGVAFVKGMKMPHSCSDCNSYNPDYCMQNNIGHRECALVELPKKHGRLVDADALIAKCGDWYTEEGTETGFIGTLEMLLKDAPTVVEAEGAKGENE